MKKIILGIVIGIIISSGIVYAATTISSSSVMYGDKTVSATLDDLINKTKVGTATAADIASGKTALVQGSLVTGTNSGGSRIIDLGTGTSFDVSSYAGYENFTVDNFIIEPINGSVSAYSSLWSSGAQSGQGRYTFSGVLNLTKSYNSSSGILSSYATISGSASSNLSGTTPARGTKDLSVNAYLIIGNIE